MTLQPYITSGSINTISSPSAPAHFLSDGIIMTTQQERTCSSGSIASGSWGEERCAWTKCATFSATESVNWLPMKDFPETAWRKNKAFCDQLKFQRILLTKKRDEKRCAKSLFVHRFLSRFLVNKILWNFRMRVKNCRSFTLLSIKILENSGFHTFLEFLRICPKVFLFFFLLLKLKW